MNHPGGSRGDILHNGGLKRQLKRGRSGGVVVAAVVEGGSHHVGRVFVHWQPVAVLGFRGAEGS